MATAFDTLTMTAGSEGFVAALDGPDRTACVLRSAPFAQVRRTIARIKRQAPGTRVFLLCQKSALSQFAGDASIDRIWEYPDQPPVFCRGGLDDRTLADLRSAGVDTVVIPEHNEDGLNYERAREMALLIANRVLEISPCGGLRVSSLLRKLITTPRQYVVAASSRCNLSCIFCASGDRRHAFGSDFPYGSFTRTLSSLDNPHAIFALLLGGEPFLNPDLLRMIRDIKLRGRFVSVTSNANLVDRATADALVACRLDELRISINATEKRLYERMMAGASWDRLMEALAALRDAKRQAGSALPRLRFIMVGMKLNIHELPQITKLAGEYGVETVILNCFMPNPRLSGQSLLEDLPALRRCYEEAVAAGGPLGVRVTLDEADQYKQALAGPGPAEASGSSAPPAATDNRTRTRLCLDPWLTVHLYETGVVLPCCGGIRHSFGDLGTTDLLDIWNGEPFRMLRDGILTGRLRPECRECRMRTMGPAGRLFDQLKRLDIQSEVTTG